MKKYGIPMVKALALALILAACLQAIGRLAYPAAGGTVFSDGWREAPAQTADVLFVGSSYMYTSLIPQKLFDDTGIASYNVSSSDLGIPGSVWLLEEELKKQRPKVVVVNTRFVHRDGGIVFPIRDIPAASVNKYTSICDYRSGPLYSYNDYGNSTRAWDSYFRVFSGRHAVDDISREAYYAMQGDSVLWRSKNYNMRAYNMDADKYVFRPLGETEQKKSMDDFYLVEPYLQRLQELGEKHGFELLLYSSPIYNFARQQYQNVLMDDYAKANGITHIDLGEWDQIDPLVDLSDDCHANIRGARKITEYFGEYFTNNYEFVDHRNDKDYDAWNQYAGSYDADYAFVCLSSENELDAESFYQHFSALDDRYMVLVASHGYMPDEMAPFTLDILQSVGLGLSNQDELSGPFAGVSVGGQVVEQSDEALAILQYNHNGIGVSIQAGYVENANGEGVPADWIYVEDKKRTVNSEGIHFVVYDTLTALYCSFYTQYDAQDVFMKE